MNSSSYQFLLLSLCILALTAWKADSFTPSTTTRQYRSAFPNLQRRQTQNAFPSPSKTVVMRTLRSPSVAPKMSVEGDFDPEALAKAREEAQAGGGSIKARVRALYKFTRPHTIRGTILASFAGTIRALRDTPGAISNANWGYMLPRAFLGMFALLLGNAFIVGINQIYDKDIDKLNKPFLPVANGEMSQRFAWVAVVASGIVGPIVV